VFSAQTQSFGRSHNLDSQVGNTYVSLALGNGQVAAVTSIPVENEYDNAKRGASLRQVG
jgi:hypothetical protein